MAPSEGGVEGVEGGVRGKERAGAQEEGDNLMVGMGTPSGTIGGALSETVCGGRRLGHERNGHCSGTGNGRSHGGACTGGCLAKLVMVIGLKVTPKVRGRQPMVIKDISRRSNIRRVEEIFT